MKDRIVSFENFCGTQDSRVNFRKDGGIDCFDGQTTSLDASNSKDDCNVRENNNKRINKEYFY